MVEAPGIEPGSENHQCRVLRVCSMVVFNQPPGPSTSAAFGEPQKISMVQAEVPSTIQPVKMVPEFPRHRQSEGPTLYAAAKAGVKNSLSELAFVFLPHFFNTVA